MRGSGHNPASCERGVNLTPHFFDLSSPAEFLFLRRNKGSGLRQLIFVKEHL